MGRSSRERPADLASKLLMIREALGLSQTEMLRRLGDEGKLHRSDIAKFELGLSEPSLLVLLHYAELANVIVNVLIDDNLELPTGLPSPQRSEGLPRQGVKKASRKRSHS